ncbi:hypothetical protein [Deinococcus sp.]|uniref:hypothetical protein n=1 Tax=Deinococcus sp. TaxID=47478 RepID=UPI003CC6CD58
MTAPELPGQPTWIDLYSQADPHPRRFSAAQTLGVYLRRIERLSDEAIAELLERGEVGPPLARREYRLERL